MKNGWHVVRKCDLDGKFKIDKGSTRVLKNENIFGH